MFPKMRRFKQELSREECIEILKNEPRGIMSVQGTNGYPYGFPMNHVYNESTGRIYLHCAKEGYKLECLRADPKVSFCVSRSKHLYRYAAEQGFASIAPGAVFLC